VHLPKSSATMFLETVNSTHQVFDHQMKETLHAHSSLLRREMPRGIQFTFKVMVLVVVIMIAAYLFSLVIDGEEEDESQVEKSGVGQIGPPLSRSPKALFLCQGNLAARPPNTRKNLDQAVDGTEGTWAYNYRKAEGKQREALELLFLCGIIPQNEFAESQVNQKHVDECAWIATCMLTEHSLDEWLTTAAQAQQVFQASVTACFSARSDAQMQRSESSIEPSSPVAAARDPQPSPVQNPTEDCLSPISQTREPGGSSHKQLVKRCREILAAARAKQHATRDRFGASQHAPVDAPLPADAALSPGPPQSPKPMQPLESPGSMPSFREGVPESGSGSETGFQEPAPGGTAASSTSPFAIGRHLVVK